MRTFFGLGAIGETIKEIQQTLTQARFDTHSVEEWYGQVTVNAVRAFQQANRLPVSGNIDDATWQALMQRAIPA
jgi:peptidoglycan hydrolase-like protein with peptidoglycan-binding domain